MNVEGYYRTTSQLLEYDGGNSLMLPAENWDKKEFIIGTEISIAEHLQYDCPDKKFHILTQKLICQKTLHE